MGFNTENEPHINNASWAGRYFNGAAPIAIKIKAIPKDGGLLLTCLDTGDVIRHCTQESLILINYTRDQSRVDLSLKGEEGVRLTLEGIGIRTELAHFIPAIGGHLPEEGTNFAIKVVSSLILFLAIGGLLVWQFQRILPSLLPNSYVHTMGESTVEFVHKVFGEQCTASKGNAALALMEKRVKGQKHFPYDLSVMVIDTPIVNALAAPGGRIVIFRGLIDEAKSPEEVAGVLGHEMGHVLNLHSLKRLSQTMGMELIFALFGGSSVTSLSQQLVLMSFSRDAESQADLVAIDLLKTSQISTAGVADFFARIAHKKNAQSQNQFSNYFASHPPSPERSKLFDAAIDEKAVPVLSSQAWADLIAICEKTETKPEED